MKKDATRTYRDLKSRTTEKSRVRQYDRIPGEQFDPNRALDEGYLNVEEVGGMDVVEEVDPGDVELVTDMAPPSPHADAAPIEEVADDHPYEGTPSEEQDEEGYEETIDEEQEEMDPKDYAEGMEVTDDDIEEAYYGDDAPVEADPYATAEDEEEEGKAEACGSKDATMLKRSEGSFADRLRKAMEGDEEGLMAELGEEVAMEPEAPAAEGPCPAGCEPVTTEEPAPVEDEGIVEVGEDEVTFLEEEPKEAATEEETFEEENLEEVTADAEEPVVEAEPAPAPVEVTDEPVYETLGNIETMADVTTDRVDLFRTNEESDNPQYVVHVDGDPIAKIALQDQPETVQVDPEVFTDDDYPLAVLDNIDQFGLQETLNYVNARYYSASAMSGEVAQQMRTAATQDMEAEHRQRLAEMNDQLINTANIVLEASLKNYITDNPLRDSLVKRLRSVNVDEHSALDIVEGAFREKGSDFFRAIIKKAEEWIGAPPEVLEHHVKEITQMNYRHPGYSPDVTDEIPLVDEQAVVEASSVPASVNIRTVASAPPAAAPQTDTSVREQLKKELNLHGMLVQKSLSNSGRKL